MRNRAALLHETAANQGLPVSGVRWHTEGGDRYEIVLTTGATQAQQDQADALAASFLARGETASEVTDRKAGLVSLPRLIRALLDKGTLTESDLGM